MTIKSNVALPTPTVSYATGAYGEELVPTNTPVMEIRDGDDNEVTTVKVGSFGIVFVTSPAFDESGLAKNYIITTGSGILTVEQYSSGGGGHSGGGSSVVATNTITKTDSTKSEETAGMGQVILSNSKPASGSTVKITVTPSTSYEQSGKPVVKDADGKQITVTENADGTFSFVMPATAVTVDNQFAPIFGEKRTTPDFKASQKSGQKVTLNGNALEVGAYNVDGYNYAKLRDIASILNATGSKFSVTTGTGRTIIVKPGESYTAVGGELELGADMSGTCVVSKWTITIDGVTRYLDVYNIGGNNYFKLRDLGELLGFGVDYDQSTNTAKIEAK